MKSMTWFNTLSCILLVLMLAACGPASPSAAGSPTETKPSSGGGLDVELSVPASLPDGDVVEVEFTLTNRSDADLYVLEWYTPLEGLAGEIFRVARDGEVLPYEGLLATRDAPIPENYVFLKRGASVSALVDLAPAYDFSRPGTYSITFLSPKISHVAKTKDELASLVDDLGPVDMPANQVAVEIASASVEAMSQPPDETVEMVRAYLLHQKPDLDPAFTLSVEKIPLEETLLPLPAQVVRVTEGPFTNESFLIHGETVLQMGTAIGGQGLTSLEVGDLDQDGAAELYFTYSFGSGIHQSRIGMYAPAYAEDRIFEADAVYLGDLGLSKADTSVSVRVVDPDPETLTLKYLETVGTLAIEPHAGQPQLILQVAPDLPDDVLENLEGVSAPEGWERYANETYGFAFQYPATWTLEAGEHQLKLQRGTLLLVIAFQWSDEEAPPPWTGIPAGDLETQEALAFMNGEIKKQVLVYKDKVKMLLYSAEVDDLLIAIRLDDRSKVDTEASYQAIEISEAVQNEVDEIVQSFERQ